MEVRFVFWKHYAGRKKFPRLPVVTVVTNFNSGTTYALYQKIFSSSDSRYLYSFSSKCWHTQTRSNQLLFKENSRTLYKQIFFPTRKKWPPLLLFLQRHRLEEHFALFPLGNPPASSSRSLWPISPGSRHSPEQSTSVLREKKRTKSVSSFS